MQNSVQFLSNDNFVQRKYSICRASRKIEYEMYLHFPLRIKDVILIIKFEPSGEFNFKKYILINSNIIML